MPVFGQCSFSLFETLLVLLSVFPQLSCQGPCRYFGHATPNCNSPVVAGYFCIPTLEQQHHIYSFQSAGTHSTSMAMFISWMSDSISLHPPYTITSLRMPSGLGAFHLCKCFRRPTTSCHVTSSHVCTVFSLELPLFHLLIIVSTLPQFFPMSFQLF